MKRVADFFEIGTVPAYALVGTAFVAFLAIIGVSSIPAPYVPDGVATMYVTPQENRIIVGDTFTIELIVESSVPVNVFAGELHFDHTMLQVTSIDYNVSIAELWAEKPWYDNGAGTLNFAGGTTASGGYLGKGSLIQVTFKTLSEGEKPLTMHNPRILLYDGLGTDASLRPTIDAIVTIDTESNLVARSSGAKLTVTKQPPSTDLNGDGKQTIADISIFMMHIAGDDARYDFNLDGKVGLKDLNILMSK